MVIYTGTSEACQRLVLGAKFFKELANLNLAHLLGQLIVAAEANLLWYLGIEVVKALDAHLLEHSLKVGISMRKVFKHYFLLRIINFELCILAKCLVSLRIHQCIQFTLV